MKAKMTFAAILVVAVFAFAALVPIADNDADFEPSVAGTYTYVEVDNTETITTDHQKGTLTYTEELDANGQITGQTIYIELERASARDSSVFLKSKDIGETDYDEEISIMNRVSGNAWAIDGISGAPLEKGKHYCITVQGSGITGVDATFEFDLTGYANLEFTAEIDEDAADFPYYPNGHQTDLDIEQSVVGVMYGKSFTVKDDNMMNGNFVIDNEGTIVVPGADDPAADVTLAVLEPTDAYTYKINWTESYYFNSENPEEKVKFALNTPLYATSDMDIHLVFTPTIAKFTLDSVSADPAESVDTTAQGFTDGFKIGEPLGAEDGIPYGAKVSVDENGVITFTPVIATEDQKQVEGYNTVSFAPAENYTFQKWQIRTFTPAEQEGEEGTWSDPTDIPADYEVTTDIQLVLVMTDSEAFQLILNERAGYYYEITIEGATVEVFSTTDDPVAEDAVMIPKNTVVFIQPVAINGYTSNLSLSYVLGTADPATATSELAALYKVGAADPGTQFPAKVVVSDTPESATADDWVVNEYAFQMTADLEIDIVLVDAADLVFAEVTDVKYAGPVQYNFTDGFIFVQVDNSNDDDAAKAITLSLGYKADAAAEATDLTDGTDYNIIALSANTFKITGIVQDGHANGIIVITAEMAAPATTWDEFYIASIDAAGVHVVMRNVNSDAVINATELATIGSYSKTVGNITKYGALGAFEITAMTDADGKSVMQSATPAQGTEGEDGYVPAATATENTLAAANQSTAYYATLSFGTQNVYSVQAMASDAQDAQTTLWVLA